MDEALYPETQHIIRQNSDQFSNTFKWVYSPELLTFLVWLGSAKISSLEDLFAEANIYGTSISQQVLNGKTYNRVIRAHTNMHGSLTRIMFSELSE